MQGGERPAPLRIGLVGTGMVSWHHLTGWQAQTGRACVVCVADFSAEAAGRRAAEFGIPRTYPSIAAMLAAEALDALDVASPRETHVSAVEQAAARGLPVLCQKPLAPRLDTAATLVARVGERTRRYYRDMASWIAAGRLGAPQQVLVTFFTSGMLPGPAGDRPALICQPFMRELDRMLVAEVLIHHLDMLHFLFGPLRVEAARLGRACAELHGEDRAAVFLSGAGGLAVTLLGNMAVQGAAPTQTDEVTVVGDDGTLRLSGDALRLDVAGGLHEERRYDLAACYRGAYNATIAHFLGRLADGAPFETSPADNLQTLRLVEDVYAKAVAP